MPATSRIGLLLARRSSSGLIGWPSKSMIATSLPQTSTCPRCRSPCMRVRGVPMPDTAAECVHKPPIGFKGVARMRCRRNRLFVDDARQLFAGPLRAVALIGEVRFDDRERGALTESLSPNDFADERRRAGEAA